MVVIGKALIIPALYLANVILPRRDFYLYPAVESATRGRPVVAETADSAIGKLDTRGINTAFL